MYSHLRRDQLVDLVRRIIAADGTEEELDDMEDLLEQNVPDPEVSDLIFYSDPSMSPEEIVDKALSYKPIILPGPDGQVESH